MPAVPQVCRRHYLHLPHHRQLHPRPGPGLQCCAGSQPRRHRCHEAGSALAGALLRGGVRAQGGAGGRNGPWCLCSHRRRWGPGRRCFITAACWGVCQPCSCETSHSCFPLPPLLLLQDMQLLAERTILSALLAGGLLRGEVEAMVEARLGAVFMPHGALWPCTGPGLLALPLLGRRRRRRRCGVCVCVCGCRRVHGLERCSGWCCQASRWCGWLQRLACWPCCDTALPSLLPAAACRPGPLPGSGHT